MRKTLYCTILFSVLSVCANAQAYYKVNHTSGTKYMAGNNVTVRHVGWIPNEYSACKTGPYRISNYKKKDTGEDTCRAYVFSFSNPVSKIRARLTNINKGEEISFWVNGNFYSLSNNDLYPYGGTCVGLPLSSIMNGRVGTDSSNSNAMVELNPGIPIDSVMIYYDKNDDAGIHFSFEFESNPKIVVRKPYYDTLKCTGDSLSIKFDATAIFNGNNTFFAELSDANGSFANPIIVGALLDSNTEGTIHCELPSTLVTGTNYRLRVSATSPYRVSDDNGTNIRVTAFPKLELSSNSPVCERQDLVFKTNDIPGGTYFWSGGGGFNSTTPSPVIKSAQVAHTGGYIVSVLLHGCKTIDTITVQVKPLPVLLDASCNTPLCEGDSLGLIANSNNRYDTFYWSGPNNFTASTASPVIKGIVRAQSGTYNVNAYFNGCFSDTMKVEAMIKTRPAIPQVTTNGPVYPGDPLKFTGYCSTPDITYSWTGPAGFTSTELNPVIPSPTTASQGDYIFTTSLDGCTSSAKIFARILGKDFFSMYPNPNDGDFTIKLNVLENQEIPLEVVNDMGQVVYREVNETKNNVLLKNITINKKLPPGMYILRVGIDKHSRNIKFRIAY